MPDQPVPDEHSAPQTNSPWTPKRLVWLGVIYGVQLLYVPINRTMQGGVVLRTLLDAYIPLWPVWAVPYLLSMLWWEGALLWAALRMDERRFRALTIAMLAVMLSSYAVYVLFPTYVERPPVESSGWAADLIRTIYGNDYLYNAFPSGHTYFTVLIALFWWDWQPRLRWLWATSVAIVILSTLFTGQHHLPDPIGGIVWAYLAYLLGTQCTVGWTNRRGEA